MAFNDGKHVMFSYCRKDLKVVSQIYDTLTNANIPVWFDLHGGVKDNLYKSMAEAVENASIVCCFMSPEYQESENCQLELTYAERQRKHIIPCIVADKYEWRPSNWLGLITSRLLYIHFDPHSEQNIDLKANELVQRIKEHSSFPDSIDSHLTNQNLGVLYERGTENCVKHENEGQSRHLVKHSHPSHKHHHPHHHHSHPH
ncbi:unnamed protein product [Adineta ricciae]|uniref:TIR domain-containing protein n=1 Tax=Adineta ricciae TaxID=249248 RepID=A0A815RJ10_ADIRI|nr:unnamed protein product [Adineta ricciae]CAF1639907.1 unnamed protein product [Adineta ricciae]